MAKDKDKKKSTKDVIKQGDKFVCTACHTEVPIKQSCPTCGKEIDWSRV